MTRGKTRRSAKAIGVSWLRLVEGKSLYTRIRGDSLDTCRGGSKCCHGDFAPYIVGSHAQAGGNGREFTNHEGNTSDLEGRVYFAHPHESLERGQGENANGHIRQRFLKVLEPDTVIEPGTHWPWIS